MSKMRVTSVEITVDGKRESVIPVQGIGDAYLLSQALLHAIAEVMGVMSEACVDFQNRTIQIILWDGDDVVVGVRKEFDWEAVLPVEEEEEMADALLLTSAADMVSAIVCKLRKREDLVYARAQCILDLYQQLDEAHDTILMQDALIRSIRLGVSLFGLHMTGVVVSFDGDGHVRASLPLSGGTD